MLHALPRKEAALGRPFLGLDNQTLANQGASSPASWLMVPRAQNLSLVIAFHNVFAPNQFHASVRTPPCTGGADLPTTNLSACERVGSHISHIQHNRYTEFENPDTMKMHISTCTHTRLQDTRVQSRTDPRSHCRSKKRSEAWTSCLVLVPLPLVTLLTNARGRCGIPRLPRWDCSCVLVPPEGTRGQNPTWPAVGGHSRQSESEIWTCWLWL